MSDQFYCPTHFGEHLSVFFFLHQSCGERELVLDNPLAFGPTVAHALSRYPYVAYCALQICRVLFRTFHWRPFLYRPGFQQRWEVWGSTSVWCRTTAQTCTHSLLSTQMDPLSPCAKWDSLVFTLRVRSSDPLW